MSLEQLTFWSQGCLARVFQRPGSNEERQMTASSGRMLLPLFKWRGPVGWLSKMLITSSIWHSSWLQLTWRAKATKSGRIYFQLVPSVRRIEDNDALLWRTPQAHDGKSGQQQQGYTMDLSHQVQALWPTPTASLPNDGNGFGTSLSMAVQMWPTSKATQRGGGASEKNRHSPDLSTVVKMGPTTSQGRLNPDWVECLMGLPVGWTDIDGPLYQETSKRNGSRRARSRTKSPIGQEG